MKVHVLGGGHGQISLIKRIKEKGYEAVVSDMNPRAPGFRYADKVSTASSFDPEGVTEDALKFGSDFFVTAGTDQPVLTAALAAEKLGKPYFLNSGQALLVTNKRDMKERMTEWGIPNRRYAVLSEKFSRDDLAHLTFPLVMKPLDSQGQRGVIRVESFDEIRKNFDYVLSFSREQELLAEEYYRNSREITVSAWHVDSKAHILSITDRVTIDNGPHIGVCTAHRYPSLCHDDWDQIDRIVQRVSLMIGLKEGPLYIQILHGADGYFVNEIACRLGGAYEDVFLPWLCGVPLLDFMIDMTVGRKYNKESLSSLSQARQGKHLSLEMFFYNQGIIDVQRGMGSLKRDRGILGGEFLLERGTEITSRNNSTQRAGYFIALSDNSESLRKLVERSYGKLTVTDREGKDMLCRFTET